MSATTTRVARLTARERFLIDLALTIAAEDGSIFGGVSGDSDEDEGIQRICNEIEAIRLKLYPRTTPHEA